jgi:hypothetical protein
VWKETQAFAETKMLSPLFATHACHGRPFSLQTGQDFLSIASHLKCSAVKMILELSFPSFCSGYADRIKELMSVARELRQAGQKELEGAGSRFVEGNRIAFENVKVGPFFALS